MSGLNKSVAHYFILTGLILGMATTFVLESSSVPIWIKVIGLMSGAVSCCASALYRKSKGTYSCQK